MRILHALDHSLPSQSGYAFRSAAILREQRRLGWETTQLTGPKHAGGNGEPALIDGIRYERAPNNCAWCAHIPAGNQLAVITSLRARLAELVARDRPDVIHAHSPCLNGLAALGLGPPVVYELRSSWEDAAVSTGTTTEGSLRYRLSRGLETLVLRKADAVVTICEGLRTDVIARGVGRDRVTVVPNAVDVDAFGRSGADGGPARERLGLPGCYVLGFIGSFFAWEGIGLLIESLPRILVRRPEARILLVGGGEQEPRLRDAAREFGVEQQVVFAGQVPHAEVANLYAAVDLLVYPRLSMRLTEMVTPLKPLEAMALGKALVASDVGGHRELIADGETGVLFRAGDPEALAQAVLRVMESETLAATLRSRGPEYVRQQRQWRSVVPAYEAVYRRVLRGAGQ